MKNLILDHMKNLTLEPYEESTYKWDHMKNIISDHMKNLILDHMKNLILGPYEESTSGTI